MKYSATSSKSALLFLHNKAPLKKTKPKQGGHKKEGTSLRPAFSWQHLRWRRQLAQPFNTLCQAVKI
jgi:hypothetical protein